MIWRPESNITKPRIQLFWFITAIQKKNGRDVYNLMEWFIHLDAEIGNFFQTNCPIQFIETSKHISRKRNYAIVVQKRRERNRERERECRKMKHIETNKCTHNKTNQYSICIGFRLKLMCAHDVSELSLSNSEMQKCMRTNSNV